MITTESASAWPSKTSTREMPGHWRVCRFGGQLGGQLSTATGRHCRPRPVDHSPYNKKSTVDHCSLGIWSTVSRGESTSLAGRQVGVAGRQVGLAGRQVGLAGRQVGLPVDRPVYRTAGSSDHRQSHARPLAWARAGSRGSSGDARQSGGRESRDQSE